MANGTESGGDTTPSTGRSRHTHGGRTHQARQGSRSNQAHSHEDRIAQAEEQHQRHLGEHLQEKYEALSRDNQQRQRNADEAEAWELYVQAEEGERQKAMDQALETLANLEEAGRAVSNEEIDASTEAAAQRAGRPSAETLDETVGLGKPLRTKRERDRVVTARRQAERRIQEDQRRIERYQELHGERRQEFFRTLSPELRRDIESLDHSEAIAHDRSIAEDQQLVDLLAEYGVLSSEAARRQYCSELAGDIPETIRGRFFEARDRLEADRMRYLQLILEEEHPERWNEIENGYIRAAAERLSPNGVTNQNLRDRAARRLELSPYTWWEQFRIRQHEHHHPEESTGRQRVTYFRDVSENLSRVWNGPFRSTWGRRLWKAGLVVGTVVTAGNLGLAAGTLALIEGGAIALSPLATRTVPDLVNYVSDNHRLQHPRRHEFERFGNHPGYIDNFYELQDPIFEGNLWTNNRRFLREREGFPDVIRPITNEVLNLNAVEVRRQLRFARRRREQYDRFQQRMHPADEVRHDPHRPVQEQQTDRDKIFRYPGGRVNVIPGAGGGRRKTNRPHDEQTGAPDYGWHPSTVIAADILAQRAEAGWDRHRPTVRGAESPHAAQRGGDDEVDFTTRIRRGISASESRLADRRSRLEDQGLSEEAIEADAEIQQFRQEIADRRRELAEVEAEIARARGQRRGQGGGGGEGAGRPRDEDEEEA